MSKRCLSLANVENTIILCEDIWLTIGESIPFSEIKSLIALSATCHAAIHWTAKPFELLFHLICPKNDKCVQMLEERRLLPLYQQHLLMTVENRLFKLIPDVPHFMRHYVALDRGIKADYRRTLLSLIYLMTLRVSYLPSDRNFRVSADHQLQYIFYRSSKEKYYVEPIIDLKFIAVAREMAKSSHILNALATAQIEAMHDCEAKELLSIGLNHHQDEPRRRAAYLALKKRFKIENMSIHDEFKALVIKAPNKNEYHYIYNQSIPFIIDFREKCIYYRGSLSDASVALYLDEHYLDHDKLVNQRIQALLPPKVIQDTIFVQKEEIDDPSDIDLLFDISEESEEYYIYNTGSTESTSEDTHY